MLTNLTHKKAVQSQGEPRDAAVNIYIGFYNGIVRAVSLP